MHIVCSVFYLGPLGPSTAVVCASYNLELFKAFGLQSICIVYYSLVRYCVYQFGHYGLSTAAECACLSD